MARTAVYRLYDENGKALYVGISGNWARRLKEHWAFSPWIFDVARMEVEWYETKDAALEWERVAIWLDDPIYNTERPVVVR